MSATQAQGMLLGLALGDALGYPVEFLSLERIRQQYGKQGITTPPNPALYTDDTQMSIALAEALIAAGEGDLETLMAAVGQGFIAWLHSQDDPAQRRAPGRTCITGVQNYAAGIPWQASGVAGSKGCGSAMRVAPIGYLYQDDQEKLKAVALASGIITHGHPAAQAASIAAAYMVKLALDGVHPSAWFAPLLHITAGISDEFDQAILRVGHVEGWINRDAALKHIGEGWVGEESVAIALYCVRQHPDDYTAAVRLAANIDGDSDSTACITGGILGARLGLAALPWTEHTENRAYLLDLGQRLAQKRQNLNNPHAI